MNGVTGRRTGGLLTALAVVGLVAGACQDSDPAGVPGEPGPRFADCNLDVDFLWAATGRDAIVALDEPAWIRADRSVPSYLDPDTRVVGIRVFGQAYAVPHNVLWYHEIVNLEPGGPEGVSVAVTYCPLTGSSLVFDRSSVGGARLGVSGVLFMNNLILFDRNEPNESLWPQMMAEAGCGARIGDQLAQHPFVEMTWAEWHELHPSTWVLAGDQGFDPAFFDYTRQGYPYGNYEEIPSFFFANVMPPVDDRRFPKERVVGLPHTAGDPGIALPFGALTNRDGRFQAVEILYEGRTAVVLWSDDARGGSAYRPRTEEGGPATLRATAEGFQDEETGSRWSIEGFAVSGPRKGERLVPVERAHTAFWGAWAAFHPDTRLWTG